MSTVETVQIAEQPIVAEASVPTEIQNERKSNDSKMEKFKINGRFSFSDGECDGSDDLEEMYAALDDSSKGSFEAKTDFRDRSMSGAADVSTPTPSTPSTPNPAYTKGMSKGAYSQEEDLFYKGFQKGMSKGFCKGFGKGGPSEQSYGKGWGGLWAPEPKGMGKGGQSDWSYPMAKGYGPSSSYTQNIVFGKGKGKGKGDDRLPSPPVYGEDAGQKGGKGSKGKGGKGKGKGKGASHKVAVFGGAESRCGRNSQAGTRYANVSPKAEGATEEVKEEGAVPVTAMSSTAREFVPVADLSKALAPLEAPPASTECDYEWDITIQGDAPSKERQSETRPRGKGASKGKGKGKGAPAKSASAADWDVSAWVR